MLTKIIKGDRRVSNLSVLLIIYAAVAGGYTISDFPDYFLNFLKSPLGQFIVYYPVLYITYKDDKDIYWTDLIFEAILMVLIVQLIKLALNRFK